MFEIFRRKKEPIIANQTVLPTSVSMAVASESKKKDIRQQPIIFQPTVYKALKPIVDELINYKKITIDLSKLSNPDRLRTIDFLSGVTYALKGHHQKVDNQIYLFVVD